jgi:hypothetical protein
VPPTSAGSGGANGVVEVGVVEVGAAEVGAADVAVVEGVELAEVEGAELPVVDFEVGEPWKSVHDSVRIVSWPELTVSELELTVYVIPSFSATK